MARWTHCFFAVLASLAVARASAARYPAQVESDLESRGLIEPIHQHADRSLAHSQHVRRKKLVRRRKRSNCPTLSPTSSNSSDASAASAPNATLAAPNDASNGTTSGAGSDNLSGLRALGITGFLSENGPGIGSWFRTDSSQDSTNGHSWCGYPYNDDTNGFAPDVLVMLDNFGGDYNKAATAYCGLEAIVTTPAGVSETMYIIDGFDHRWVRTPGSIDITKNRFAELYGSATDDKDIVIKGIIWSLTGNRSDQYQFKGAGN